MTITSKVNAAISRPGFAEERLLPLFPDLARYELIEINDLPVLKIYIPAPTEADLPTKIKIAGQKVRFEYHSSAK